MRRLGARSGARACYLLASATVGPGSPKPLRIRETTEPIWLRNGTSDFEVMEEIFVHREYDFTGWPSHHAMVERAYADAISAGKVPVILDCGANIGLASIWFALRYPRARIYAIEPEPDNFAMLRRNVGGYANVVPVHAAISDQVTRVSLRNPQDQPWACQTEEDETGGIETVTIPDLFARFPDSEPLIVKVDIEGHETTLFRSNTDWADDTPLVVFEMHDWLFAWRGTGDAILRCLTQRSRDYLIRGEHLFAFAHPTRRSARGKVSVTNDGFHGRSYSC
jgi:FkbM family methyltransferase